MAYGRNKLKTIGVVVGLLMLVIVAGLILVDLPFWIMALHGD